MTDITSIQPISNNRRRLPALSPQRLVDYEAHRIAEFIAEADNLVAIIGKRRARRLLQECWDALT